MNNRSKQPFCWAFELEFSVYLSYAMRPNGKSIN
jgi:hypothetical protein